MSVSKLPRESFVKSLKRLYDFLVAAPNLLNDYESITTGSVSVEVDKTIYQTLITSGGTAGNEAITIGAATNYVPGTRKFIKLATRTHASDAITLDYANVSTGALTISDITLNVAGEFILLEAQGAKWEVIKASSTVVTAA